MTQSERDIRRKIAVLDHAEVTGNVSKTCRYFGVSRDSFYRWKRQYQEQGREALVNNKPGCRSGEYPHRYSPEIEKRILELRRGLELGQLRITWYLARYHGIRVSPSGVYGALLRNGMNRLPDRRRARTVGSWKRYEKEVPGHHVQMDVKFVDVTTRSGKKVRRYQYTAIDDATRVRALKIYRRHTQANAIDFMNYVVERFPFSDQASTNRQWSRVPGVVPLAR